jgi:S1-C subfamily serine protease
MAEPNNSLLTFSTAAAELVEHAARSMVAVAHGGRGTVSGIHWRPGVIVTAEEVLEQEKDIAVTLPGGRTVTATLAGRDPSTDVAVLRVASDGLDVAQTADAASLRPGHLVFAIGNHAGAALAALGTVAYAGGPWQSMRGGAIDSFLRLDLALNPAGEGGALVDVQGRVLGMVVFGPRRRVLAIPGSTIDRAVDQLLAKGYVGRGYLGAGLQHVRVASDGARRPAGRRYHHGLGRNRSRAHARRDAAPGPRQHRQEHRAQAAARRRRDGCPDCDRRAASGVMAWGTNLPK